MAKRPQALFKRENSMTQQRVIITHDLERDLTAAISQCEHDRLFVLTDETTARLCWPAISGFSILHDARLISIPSGDTHKSVDTLASVWQQLGQGGCTRHSCLVNLGGGMVTDLGGFAAATFKRGINFINIPTTLLAMVDASVGGKTGINFGGLKNEVGAFCDSRYVLLSTQFLSTLDAQNLRSGYAEMLKHGLISNVAMWSELLNFSLDAPDLVHLQQMVGRSVEVKERIVAEDPREMGIRKALNLGHTIGHAFESWAMKSGRPILHGYAVAFGLVAELYLSSLKTGFPADRLHQTCAFIREAYGSLPITCDHYPALLQLMRHDKKNTSGTINFTLLGDVGDIRINQTATDEEILQALDFFREA